MRLSVGLLTSRRPVAVWKFLTMISPVTTCTMSVSSQTPSTVICSARTTMPAVAAALVENDIRLPRTRGPALSSNPVNRSMPPVLRPVSGRSTSDRALALMLTTAPAFARKSLATMIGWAPRTKTVAASLVPRPLRFEVALPEALFSSRLFVSRRSAWCTSITLKASNVPSIGVVPPPNAM